MSSAIHVKISSVKYRRDKNKKCNPTIFKTYNEVCDELIELYKNMIYGEIQDELTRSLEWLDDIDSNMENSKKKINIDFDNFLNMVYTEKFDINDLREFYYIIDNSVYFDSFNELMGKTKSKEVTKNFSKMLATCARTIETRMNYIGENYCITDSNNSNKTLTRLLLMFGSSVSAIIGNMSNFLNNMTEMFRLEIDKYFGDIRVPVGVAYTMRSIYDIVDVGYMNDFEYLKKLVEVVLSNKVTNNVEVNYDISTENFKFINHYTIHVPYNSGVSGNSFRLLYDDVMGNDVKEFLPEVINESTTTGVVKLSGSTVYKDLVDLAIKNGFSLNRTNGSHNHYVHEDGRTVCITRKSSYGIGYRDEIVKQITNFIDSKFAKSMNFSNKDFIETATGNKTSTDRLKLY